MKSLLIPVKKKTKRQRVLKEKVYFYTHGTQMYCVNTCNFGKWKRNRIRYLKQTYPYATCYKLWGYKSLAEMRKYLSQLDNYLLNIDKQIISVHETKQFINDMQISLGVITK